MQKIFLLLILFSTSIYSQNNFKGWWQCKVSEYITIISAGEYGVSQVMNYNPFSDSYVEEKIIKKNKNTFVTTLFNPENGYFVKIKYKLKDKNNLICKYSGDYNETLHLTRYKFDFLDNELKK
tara:strand:- start:273 stop:641 length:369 start_codon:yes stop_codon:yes gene_type:complete